MPYTLSAEQNRIYSSIDSEFNDFIETIENNEYVNIDTTIIQKAYSIAKILHHGVMRKSGEFYLYHPFAVCKKLFNDGFADVNLLAAALLHDTVEDTPYTLEQIQADFNSQVSDYVSAVTKIARSIDPKDGNTKNQAQWRTDSHMLESLDKNKFALYIKFADRWHNLRTMQKMSKESKKYNINHTRNVLIPLARRIGCNLIAEQLEDACFFASSEKEYLNIVERQNTFQQGSRKSITKTIQAIIKLTKGEVSLTTNFEMPLPYIVAAEIREKNFNANLRRSDLFSFYQYQPYAIIYFKIKKPTNEPLKQQFYRLCTKLIGDRRIFDSDNGKKIKSPVENVSNDCIDICDNYNNKIRVIIIAEENYKRYVNAIANYHNHHRIIAPETLAPGKSIIVYSKDGQAIEIEKGCTVLDFAFYINTALGSHYKEALVNGVIVQIDYVLQAEDKIEIKKDAEQTAKINWFRILKTRTAINRLVDVFENVTE